MLENTVTCGDVIEVLSQLPDACVDAIVTDPPYGLEFMGKEWDKFGEGSNWATKVEILEPVEFGKPLKIKKRGGIPGADSQAIPVRFSLSSKEALTYQSWTTSWATEAYRILKPGAYMLVMGGTRTHHRLGCGLEDAGFQIRDCLMWIHSQGFPKNYDVSKGIDKRAGAEREVIRPNPNLVGRNKDRSQVYSDYSFEDLPMQTKSATPEAQYWEGYGTALKPAHEPIWLCKKPNEGMYVDNCLKYGVGAMNIDGCRVEYQGTMHRGYPGGPGGKSTQLSNPEPTNREQPWYPPPSGRWPANVIVDCYPEEFQGGAVIEGEGLLGKKAIRRNQNVSWCISSPPLGVMGGYDENGVGNGLLGPYTRFFVIPKPSKAEKACNGRVENKHVTVKSVRLGKWLIKLITPHQHPVVLLDPFCGSGSFLVAAQELNYEAYQIEFYGIDKDKDSVETARARLEAMKRLL